MSHIKYWLSESLLIKEGPDGDCLYQIYVKKEAISRIYCKYIRKISREGFILFVYIHTLAIQNIHMGKDNINGVHIGSHICDELLKPYSSAGLANLYLQTRRWVDNMSLAGYSNALGSHSFIDIIHNLNIIIMQLCILKNEGATHDNTFCKLHKKYLNGNNEFD